MTSTKSAKDKPPKRKQPAKSKGKAVIGTGADNPKGLRKAAKKVVALDRDASFALAKSRNNPVMKAIGFLAEAGDQPPLIIASVGTLAIGLATRRGDLARGGGRMLLSHLLATGMKLAIKHQIDRTRPSEALDSGTDRFEVGDTGGHEEKSFPSGHTAGAVAVALAAGHDIDGAAIPAAAAAAAIAAAQAPAGHHYILDVVVGGAIGWASEAVVSAVFDRLEPKVEELVEELKA